MIARVEHGIPSKKKERERREGGGEGGEGKREEKNGDSLYSLHRRVITRGKLLYGSLCVANKDAFAKSVDPTKQIAELFATQVKLWLLFHGLFPSEQSYSAESTLPCLM